MRFIPGEINIICTNLDQSLHFYCDVLGFEKASEENGAVHLQCQGRLYLLLPFAQQSSDTAAYCSKAEFSMDLMVDDIQQAANYLHQHQVAFIRDLQPDGTNVFIRDPDGLVWEIIQSKS